MPSLLIKCSQCKAIIDTGVVMDMESFCSSKIENRKLECSSCSEHAVWNKDDVLAVSFCTRQAPRKK